MWLVDTSVTIFVSSSQYIVHLPGVVLPGDQDYNVHVEARALGGVPSKITCNDVLSPEAYASTIRSM